MGSRQSVTEQLTTNVHLNRFCDDKAISAGDEFWSEMLRSESLISVFEVLHDQVIAEAAFSTLLEKLSSNNPKSRNVQTLERILTDHIESKSKEISTRQQGDLTSNEHITVGLVIFRIVFKHFLCNPENRRNLKDVVLDDNPPFKSFLSAAINLFSVADASADSDILAEVEAILVLCLASVKLNVDPLIVNRLVEPCFLSFDSKSRGSVLINILKMVCIGASLTEEPLPDKARRSITPVGTSTTNGSLQRSGLASNFKEDTHLLSMHLFCLLTYANISASSKTSNPYKIVLSSIFQSNNGTLQENSVSNSNGNSSVVLPSVSLQDINDLCHMLCETDLLHENGILLIYTLLYNCPYFRSVYMSRSSLDHLVLYLLDVIDHIQSTCPHHHSMCVLILLMLTEDSFFTSYLQETTLDKMPRWYKGRQLSPFPSLSNFVFIVILKQLKRNLYKTKDRYLSNNCVGILCNMAHEIQHIHWFTAHLLIDMLRSAYYATNVQNDNLPEADAANPSKEAVSGDSADGNNTDRLVSNDINSISATKELVYVLIDILNIILCKHLRTNVDLLYMLLYENLLLTDIHNYITLMASENINKVIIYLREIFDSIDEPNENYLKIQIEAKIKLFPISQLTPLKEIRFRYVEQTDASRFFMPYIWSLMYDSKYIGKWPSEDFKIVNYSNLPITN